MVQCPVSENCKVAGKNCPYCVNGSEYRPVDKHVLFPAEAERVRARADARREHKKSAAYRSGKKSNRKGKRREREVAKLLGGERVPLSGALDGHPNDVVLPNGWRTEVKARSGGLGLIYGWLGDAEVVAFRETGEEWLFAMTLQHFKLWLGGGRLRRQPVAAALAALRRGEANLVIAQGVRLVAHERKSGFATIRSWLAAENADALLYKADRHDWLTIMDAEHLRDVLAGEAANSAI
ncbi:MAG: hypothetical protein M0Z66_03050 [Thermaerobacter sp.]|nr:hypothetical protein [Thermaerobacter sp.]